MNMEFYQHTEAEEKLQDELQEKMMNFDKLYFDDFNFTSKDFKGHVHTYTFRENCYIMIEPIDGNILAKYNDHRISVPPDVTDDTILHEMIHAHIDMLKRSSLSFFSEYLIFALYKKLRRKIKDIDRRIWQQVSYCDFIQQAEWHGLLFFLKSLDLDLRLEYPLGTVYGIETGWQFDGYD